MTAHREYVMRHFKDQYESLSLLIEGITIDSIAEFNLETCREDETVGDVLKRMTQMDIDQMPVSPERTHYIAREGLEQLDPETLIRETVKKPIGPPLLLAGGTSLLEAYPLFKEEAFLFLLQGNRVEGIVTRGDFQRAPFRMYLFGVSSQ
jgi:predicted transcriptional regulator